HREARLLLHNKFVVVLGDSSEQFFSTFTTYKCVLSTVLITVCLNESYNPNWTADYKENLKRFFDELKMVLPEESLVIWNLTMPLGKRIKGGFLVPEIVHKVPQLRYDVIEANFYGWTLADAYEMDVLDLHFQFRFSLQHRTTDGIHWNAIAHRRITALLLQHIAQAWGVTLAAEGEDGNINALFVSEVPDQNPFFFFRSGRDELRARQPGGRRLSGSNEQRHRVQRGPAVPVRPPPGPLLLRHPHLLQIHAEHHGGLPPRPEAGRAHRELLHLGYFKVGKMKLFLFFGKWSCCHIFNQFHPATIY
uniref:Family with sequence similarity 113 n=1 Tax=Fundulus heteroclitus TaxID=8078 RepID=A0A3Q2QZP1_FUNHE